MEMKKLDIVDDGLGYNSNDGQYNLDFLIPSYGVQDFINDRAMWAKGTHNMTGEPGWFYFKLFFKFNDDKGLFGGLMGDTIPVSSAIRYLYGIRDFYKHDKIYDRMMALTKFTFTLSYINSISPWFFIGLNGINKLNAFNLRDTNSKDKTIDIICNVDAIDMRLNTLLDMYKYACYDEMNFKEIIPENLRKFDMSILIMNIPIKYFQTAIIVSGKNPKLGQIGSNGSTIINKALSGINKITGMASGSDNNLYKYKTTIGDGNIENNRLSFQMFTLKNCEIDPISFENYMPGSINNSQFFNLGHGAIKINYDRCFKHTANEWNSMMYGSDGFLYDKFDNYARSNRGKLLDALFGNNKDSLPNDIKPLFVEDTSQSSRIDAIKKSIYNNFFNKDTEAYKSLIDFSESVIEDSMINVNDPYYLGNIGMKYNDNDYKDIWNKTKNKLKKFASLKT